MTEQSRMAKSENNTDGVSTRIERTLKSVVPLSFGEEVGNAVSHGVAAFAEAEG